MAVPTPYCDADAERAAVASFIASPRAQRSLGKVQPDDFHTPYAADCVAALQALKAAGKTIDLVTLNDALTRQGKSDAILWAADVTTTAWTPAAQIDDFLEIIKGASMRRKLYTLCKATEDAVSDFNADPVKVLADMRTTLQMASAASQGMEQKDCTAGAVAVKAFTALQSLMAGEVQGLKTGIARIDEMLGGIFPGELIVIGARPGTGKTAIGMDFARRFCEAGNAGLVASLEMTDTQLMNRMLASAALVDAKKLRTGKGLTDDDFDRLSGALSTISAQKLWISENVRTVTNLRDEIVTAREKFGHLEFVLVDYLQLMSSEGRSENRTQEVGKISRELKMLAKEQHVAMILISQLNRGMGERPAVSNLRESGQIEQDANMILLLYSPERAEDVRPQELADVWKGMVDSGRRLVECNIAKARDGETGVVLLEFVPQVMRYQSLFQSTLPM